ncbi:MAG: prolyl-tRNA synthetase associated domain-containing protein [Rhodospirillales bacterium]|nr:prolyl-tRNA synthetase associated domain-containing protein [Rhodospirillales bacterium]
MKNTKEDLFERLNQLGIETQTVEHPPAFTVEDAKAHRGNLSGAHSKNLFLKDKKGQLWLVVCLEDREVNMKDLKTRIGSAHLSFGKTDLLMDVLGVSPGSVSPFTLINDAEMRVRVVLDQEMMACLYLNFHPLENTATTQISNEGLLSFIKSCGHQTDIVAL